MSKKLAKKIFIRGKIKTLTGLHIGGNNSSVDIGGIDAYVIRDSFSNKPYIPGSSLKGKMRSLIEQVMGNYAAVRMGVVQNGPSENTNDNVVKLFGTAKNDNNVPSKIIVRDCQLLSKYDHISELAQYTEIKTEVVIDRITAAAMPRTLERVPAGVEFEMEIVLNIWEGDNELSEDEAMRLVFMAMLLLESDYLGGKGSRGSGQVKIGIATITERNAAFYKDVSNIQQSSFTISEHQANIPNSLRIWTH